MSRNMILLKSDAVREIYVFLSNCQKNVLFRSIFYRVIIPKSCSYNETNERLNHFQFISHHISESLGLTLIYSIVKPYTIVCREEIFSYNNSSDLTMQSSGIQMDTCAKHIFLKSQLPKKYTYQKQFGKFTYRSYYTQKVSVPSSNQDQYEIKVTNFIQLNSVCVSKICFKCLES